MRRRLSCGALRLLSDCTAGRDYRVSTLEARRLAPENWFSLLSHSTKNLEAVKNQLRANTGWPIQSNSKNTKGDDAAPVASSPSAYCCFVCRFSQFCAYQRS